MNDLIPDAPRWLLAPLLVAGAVGTAWILHAALFWVLQRAAARTTGGFDNVLLVRFRWPTRAVFLVVALSAVQPALILSGWGVALWQRIAGLVAPALVGWLAVAAINAMTDLVMLRSDVAVRDNLAARRRRTRAGLLRRVALYLVLAITFFMMLMTIPSVRDIGVTLIASAGLAGLAVAAAAQPTLRNLIAGFQMAFSEPIRLDDVVIVDGEWGRVEEIRLTYVVIRIWDERRLVVPLSRFFEESFQNWTRESSELLGTVFLQVDQTADVSAIRRKFEEIVRSDPHWDQRVAVLQVTDSDPGHLELRALVSASDAGTLFDLRCSVREAMIDFLAREMPGSLPRRREQIIEPEQPDAPAARQLREARR
jgi:small-conductance mechanosensitive channel